jgi:phospholipid transport system transporter-binding protein
MSAAIAFSEPGRLVISGHLDFSKVAAIYQSGLKYITQKKMITVDMSAVAGSDSSGLAMVLAWHKAAVRAGTTLNYQGVPQQLLAMAEISDVLPVFRCLSS